MSIFLKAVAGVLTAVILWLTVNKDNKGISTLLTLAVCIMVFFVCAYFLQPIIDFIHKLELLGELDEGLISIVLKVVGIGLLTEISAAICKDSGNESMGKSLQILSAVAAIWLSIPVFERLITLLDKILGTI
jgi:stage III sporulation protein AD